MKTIRSLKIDAPLIILIAAVLITLVVGGGAYQVMRIYRIVQPIWVEQAAYSQAPMLAFSALLHQNGFWYAISQMGGERHLLQLVILGIFAPSQLNAFHAPLLIALPTLTVFLAMFGWTVYQRTTHLGYAVVSMLFYCSIAQITFHAWGVGSGFADWQAMFLLSAAALCLINALIHPGIFWIRMFSLFVSLAVLARTTATFYAAVTCAPMIGIYLIEQYKRERSIKQPGITILNILVVIMPAAVIVLGQLSKMFLYYGSVNAWNLHQPFGVSAYNIFISLLTPFMGKPLILTCVVLFLFQIYKNFSRVGNFTASGIALGWWIVGYLGFLLAYGYTSDVPKEVMYVVPALLLVSVAPFSGINQIPVSYYKLLSAGLAVFSVIFFGWNVLQNIGLAKVVTPEQAALRSVQYEMAEIISSLPSDIIWQSYTSVDWGIPVSLRTQYDFGEYRQYGGTDFYNKKAYWDTWYPTLTLEELQNKVYAQTMNCVDAVVILKDPDLQPSGMEDYSYVIAAFIAGQVKADSNWELVSGLDGWPVGTKYQIYKNNAPASLRSCRK
ncbi:MAG: hypothetical protein IPP55_07600 [Anaerolineales bacterium]|nr:hypothetical protein [Anaerolineales bacterium]